MPKVGSKSFSYSPKGVKAAKSYAKKTGKPLMTTEDIVKRVKKMGSGMVKRMGKMYGKKG